MNHTLFGRSYGRAVRRLALLLFVAASPAWSQLVADPNDPVYRYLDLWEQRGYLTHLPPLRPYPVGLVKRSLETVRAHGAKGDAALAERFLSELEESWLPVPLRLDATYELQTKGSQTQNRPAIELSGTGELGRRIGYSIRGRLLLETGTGGEVYPRWDDGYGASVQPEIPYSGGQATDPIVVGGVPFKGFGVLTGMLSYGTDRLYAQAGLVRSSFGPVLESPVLGPQAPEAGHFSVTYQLPWLTVNVVLLELVARYGVRPTGELYALKGAEPLLYSQKYLIMHTIGVHPLTWLDVDLFQTVVFGGRFSPSYLLPFSVYTQVQLGDWDNALFGLSLKLSLPYAIRPSFLLYVDDLHLQKLVKLDFDTNGNKVALQASLDWSAPLSFPNQLSLSYTAVTPYMYTHFAGQPLNYLQYTHYGSQLGSVLPPNSDQWSLRLLAAPLPGLSMEAWGKRIRHGNGSDYGSGSVDGDGSVYDDGQLPDGTVTFREKSSFLTQAVLEEDVQFGVDANVDVRWRGLRARLGVGYTLELVRNRALDPTAVPETNHMFSLDASLGL